MFDEPAWVKRWDRWFRRWLRAIPWWGLNALLAGIAVVLATLIGLTAWRAIGWARHGQWWSVLAATTFWGYVLYLLIHDVRRATREGREDAMRELREHGIDP